MKIVVLAYDSQPGWSGIVLRASAVTWQLSQNQNLFPPHGTVLKLLVRTGSVALSSVLLVLGLYQYISPPSPIGGV
jgi:hypothetical protein